MCIRDSHYTLYYYNQAGNLIKTVPPAGVDDLSSYKSKRTNAAVAPLTGKLAFLYDVKQARKDALVNGANINNQLQPPHTMFTQYCFNSLGQVTTQYTPDAHQSKFWYDALGRLVAVSYTHLKTYFNL